MIIYAFLNVLLIIIKILHQKYVKIAHMYVHLLHHNAQPNYRLAVFCHVLIKLTVIIILH